MTEEIKRDFDDVKDLASQVKLEVKKRSRNSHRKAQKRMGRNPPLSTQLDDHVENAKDLGTQINLEAHKQTRDAKLAFHNSELGKEVEYAKDSVSDAAAKTKSAALDAVLPSTKTVEATSSRGINITHVENGKNERLETERRAALERQAHEEEKQQEEKRKQLLQTAKDKTAAVGVFVSDVRDKAAVAIGKAALSAKDTLDAATDKAEGKPIAVTQVRTSASGIDTSSVQNVRNEELRAKDEREQALAKAREKSLGEKISEVGAKVKAAVTNATTEAPAPLYVAKRSDRGVDISHVENAANAELARQEELKLAEEKRLATLREKEVLGDQLAEEKDDLNSKLDALGQSISRAANKLGSSIQGKYRELIPKSTPDATLDVHEKTSENGIDTTSIANAQNNAIGEAMKQERNSVLPLKPEEKAAIASRKSDLSAATLAPASSSSTLPPSGSGKLPPPSSAQLDSMKRRDDAETAAIKKGLDGGVAVQQTAHTVAGPARLAGAELQAAKHETKGAMAVIKEDLKAVGNKAAEKVAEVTIAPTAI